MICWSFHSTWVTPNTWNINWGQFFNLKDLGELKQFPNVELNCATERLAIRQLNLIKTLSEDTGMLACKPQTGLVSPGHYLNEQSTWVPGEIGQLHRSRVGSLLQLSTKSKQNHCLEASSWGSYVADPTDADVKEVKHALRYLTGTCNTELLLKHGEYVQLSGHADANWVGEAHAKRRSKNGILIQYGNAVRYAASALQKCVLWVRQRPNISPYPKAVR